jgi:Protein of unknown function (DUF2891)
MRSDRTALRHVDVTIGSCGARKARGLPSFSGSGGRTVNSFFGNGKNSRREPRRPSGFYGDAASSEAIATALQTAQQDNADQGASDRGCIGNAYATRHRFGPRPTHLGDLDWHSCVHGFWLLAKILRLFPDLPQAVKIRGLFAEQLTPDKIAGELSYLERPSQENFERPYGWAWLLMLTGELARHTTADAQIWHDHLQPLARLLAGRFGRYVSKLPFPIRAGTHPNTAFAAILAIEYAEVCGEVDLLTLVRTRMREFFASDVNCQALEPSGNDFHSPLLIEMECMRRALDRLDFLAWVGRFLPRLAEREPGILFEPVAVVDHSDPQIVHLDGLNFSRAWCWRAFAAALPNRDVRRKIALDAAEAHVLASLPHITSDYMGEHWLATYAMLALTA